MTSMATKYSPLCFTVFSSLLLILLATTSYSAQAIKAAHGFSSIKEATVHDIQLAFKQNQLTSRKLVELYLKQISRLNPVLKGVLEVNPDALYQADKADHERKFKAHGSLSPLHGIPILLKDNIATKDKLNTTAGSYALLGSVVPRDAGVVTKLRKAGAIILGKATLSEWSYQRSSNAAPDGWNARKGQGKNPYLKSGGTCGSSSGSAISVAANMVSVSLGTETDGSIICPADHNSVVGIKPTVGLTSRAGVIQISPRQDTIGPICRTVTDAVYVLDAIVGFDPRDYEATKAASVFIPPGGYRQFLNENGLKGKRLGVVRELFLDSYNGTSAIPAFKHHLNVLRQKGATIVDNLEIANIDVISDRTQSGELIALLAEFKISLNDYLKELSNSRVKSLADIIAFNLNNPVIEKLKEYGQDEFIASENTTGIGKQEKEAIEMMANLSKYGFEKLMKDNNLDAMLTIGSNASTVLAIGGYPAITVPAGYESNGMPFGISFGGLRGSEPKLIEISYAFEQATRERRPPSFLGRKMSSAHLT